MNFCLELGDGVTTLHLYLNEGEVKVQWEIWLLT